MAVLIKGMEMPTCCYQCWFLFHPERHGRVFCTGVEPMMDISETLSDERASGCPLVPVPPHGDLIDRDPFVQFIKSHWDSSDQWFVEQLEARPTIIPADPAEEGEA